MPSKSEFLISICIPTRNRSLYVSKVVLGLLSQFGEEIEIIVSDNSDEINKILVELDKKNPNIVYFHETKELSFADNFERAIAAAKGEYITTIGDDDYVLPEIHDAVLYAKRNRIDSIISRLDYVYFWPGVSGRTDQYEGALKTVATINDEEYEFINQQSELKKFLEGGMREFENSNLARIYHGIVSKKILDSIIKKHGRLFGGLSPDIYSSIMLSTFCENTLKWPRPLTVPGVCSVSGSGQSAEGKHRGKLENAPHFRGHEKYRWEKEIPQYYSVDTIWAESAIKALKMCQNSKIQDTNYNKLYAKSLINNLKILGEALISTKNACSKASNFGVIFYFFIYGLNKIINRIKRKKYRTISTATTICEAAAGL